MNAILKPRIVVFNKDSVSPWIAYENTQVMVSNRNGKDAQIFCKAIDVQIGDNVWEHNIVQTIEVMENWQEVPDNTPMHYGPIHKE